jgi:CheY-like chemotaxis protein
MRTLLEDGIAKAAMGLTTLEEVLRVAPRLDAAYVLPHPRASAAQKPATASAPSLPSSGASTVPASAAPPAHILVLEDDADTQALLQLLLTKNGYAVTIAGDGIDALMCLGKQRFDLILSDVNMPNLGGIQLLEITRQKGLRLPVIFLTADSTEESELRCLELGAIDYLKKPIKKDLLLLRVQRALRTVPIATCP